MLLCVLLLLFIFAIGLNSHQLKMSDKTIEPQVKYLREEYESLDSEGKIQRYYLDWLEHGKDDHDTSKEDLEIITLHNNVLQMESQIEVIKGLISNGNDGKKWTEEMERQLENITKTIKYAIDALTSGWHHGDDMNQLFKE